MKGTPTVYIVDDDPSLVEAVRHLLRPMGLRIETYSSAEQFLTAYRPNGPACLVLDVRMPGMSGLMLQRQLADRGVDLPVIIITAHADVRMTVDAMKTGAVEFLEKPFRPQALYDAVQAAVRADEEAWQKRAEEENVERKLAGLTPAEREVLELVATGRTNKEIAEELGLSVRGVENRRAKLMQKVGVSSKRELLELVRPVQRE